MSEDLKSHTMINRCDPTGRLILLSTHSHGAGKARRIGTVTTANARLAPRGAWHDTLSTQLRDFHSYCSKSARWCHFKTKLSFWNSLVNTWLSLAKQLVSLSWENTTRFSWCWNVSFLFFIFFNITFFFTLGVFLLDNINKYIYFFSKKWINYGDIRGFFTWKKK